MENLSFTLESYGADLNSLRLFDAEDPGLLPYATLIAARNTGDKAPVSLLGVYEWQSNPLVFLVDGNAIQDDDHFRRIRRCVALRGDAPYLGVIRPGQLTVHRVALDSNGQSASRLRNLPPPKEKRATFPDLANARPEAASQHRWISQVVLKLLHETISTLTQYVTHYDAISLAGRALFIRFLGDRELLPPAQESAAEWFDDAAHAERASRWLDDTFNGDFLPLSDGLFGKLPEEAFHILGNILRRASGGQLHLGWQEKWDYLDFAHIPVGVLSEAYAHYMRKHKPDQQWMEGGYYTPRAIADLMVRGAFLALRREGVAHQSKVLDPAAGAGVFLVSAFRQLVAERWLHDAKRPDTQILREILYNQLVGFDINEAALRFAALGLYLMAIELDPEPEPVEKLRFTKNLRDTVLHDLRNGEIQSLGSLGKKVSAKHVGHYDLVIGNPPWSSATKLTAWSEVEEIVTRIAGKRLPHDITPPPLPNEVLDLPFVWRAMEWGKSRGQIAFTLHGRLLFQQADGMAQARSALFRALDVTGVLNGAELRQTPVWPEISAPFCLLFARNQLPSSSSAFRFVSPHVEKGLNGAGAMRVDAANAEWVTSHQVAERPEILKILFRGSALDLEIFDRMTAQELIPLEQYWQNQFGEYKGRALQAGNGYQKLRPSSRVRKEGDGQPGVPASYLADLPELTSEAMQGLLVDAAKLGEFTQIRIHDPRPRSLFREPLLIVHKSPPAGAGRIRLGVSDSDLVFNETYYGYSAHKHSHGALLVRYLALLVGSKPAFWYTLMASGEFGVEREVVEKSTIDNIPIIPFESLTSDALGQINPLFDALVKHESPENWAAVDAWAATLYGLREKDLQVINDTLRFNLPFASNKKAAQAPPTREEVKIFCDDLENELKSWAEREGSLVKVQPVGLGGYSPWRVVRVCSVATSRGQSQHLAINDWPEVLRIADSLAATEVIHPDPVTNCLWVARLNQARYWSCSQARLVARRVVWEHLDTLFGSDAE
jgi:N-6 DNA Methylase